METIVAFDFDGTITTRDTLPDFLVYTFGRGRFYRGIVCVFPWLAAYKMGILSSDCAKERLLSFFLKGYSEDQLAAAAQRYSRERLPDILRGETMTLIREHREAGHRMLIVSASPENWIKPWALEQGFDEVIATRLDCREGVLTGMFGSANCCRAEKVKRLVAAHPQRNEYVLYAYGDSRGDRELLEFADFGTLIKK